MKKIFLLAAIAGLFACSSANAQVIKSPKLGIGAEFGFPIGDSSKGTDFGFGGSLQYQHPVAENLLVTGSAGYLNFKDKDSNFGGMTIKGENYGFIPVKAGARYYFGENFFVNGELGAAFSTKSGAGGSTAFVYSPGAGVEFEVSDKSSLELGARYEGWSKTGTLSFIGLRAAFNFGL